MTEYREGQTATHPDGRRVVYKGGQWVSDTAARPSFPAPKEMAGAEWTQLAAAREAANGSDEAARMAEQFVELNRKQGSGQIWAIPGAPQVMGVFDPEISRMNALTARMAPQQRVEGSGTTSDRDLSLYLQAVPSMSKPGDANSAIAMQARKDAQRRIEYAQFLDRYARENGSLLGSDEAWRKTGQSVPATTGSGLGGGKPNIPEPVMKTFRTGKWDRSQPVGSRLHPYLARDEATLDRLPKGSWAIGPDGQYGQVE